MTTTKQGHTHNLLLISENQLSLKSLSGFTESQGYQYKAVDGCDSALDLIRRSNFDLIILAVGHAPARWNALFDFVRANVCFLARCWEV